VQSKVGTCTLLRLTKHVMKASSEGMTGSVVTAVAVDGKAPLVGVAGGVGSGLAGAGQHWMTLTA
jgi:hypothetical protein